MRAPIAPLGPDIDPAAEEALSSHFASTESVAAADPSAAHSRRRWLKALAAGAFPLAAQSARAATPPQPWDRAADVDSSALLPKLIRRITMGFSTAELTLASQKGYQGYLEYHLNHTAIDDSAIAERISALYTLVMPPAELFFESSALIIEQMLEATVIRSLYSKRQLFQRTVEFWTDHFNIDTTKLDCAFLKIIDDTQVIRQYALTNFPQLLRASAQSPAMQIYLDNLVSTKYKPNENYARELLELHTMGVDGGYTQQDVQTVAKCFTGWGVYDRGAAPQLTGTFRFKDVDHDNTEKRFLGHIIPAGGGIIDGLTILNILADHPSTARFISRKLCRWFLGDATPNRIIDSVAATYTATGGDIKAMIRTILSPNNLYAAPPRYKRPYHMYISALRALNAELQGYWPFKQWIIAAGHLPFHWLTPDGYPDSTDFWSGSILQRWNFAASYGASQISGVAPHLDTFFGTQTSPQQVIDKLDLALFAGEMPAPDKERIRAYLNQQPGAWELIRDAVGLAFALPAFQWY